MGHNGDLFKDPGWRDNFCTSPPRAAMSEYPGVPFKLAEASISATLALIILVPCMLVLSPLLGLLRRSGLFIASPCETALHAKSRRRGESTQGVSDNVEAEEGLALFFLARAAWADGALLEAVNHRKLALGATGSDKELQDLDVLLLDRRSRC